MALHQSIAAQLFEWMVESYHRLPEADILDPDIRVELLEGQIIQISP